MTSEIQGLWIDIQFCTGCKACEMACRQEHELGPDEYGIKVEEQLLNNGRTYNYIPIPTGLCDLCEERTRDRTKQPSCVHHCMADVMRSGPLTELIKHMQNKPNSVIWAPGKEQKEKPFENQLR